MNPEHRQNTAKNFAWCANSSAGLLYYLVSRNKETCTKKYVCVCLCVSLSHARFDNGVNVFMLPNLTVQQKEQKY